MKSNMGPTPNTAQHSAMCWLWLIAAALLSACGAESDEAGAGAPSGDNCAIGECPCPSDPTCDQGGQVSVESLTLAIRVVPPRDSDLVEQHVTGIIADADLDLGDVILVQPTIVRGSVSFPNPARSPASRVLFRRQGGIEQTPIFQDVTTDGSGHFEVELAPGTYQVLVDPDDVTAPPFRVSELEVAGEAMEFQVPLPDPASHFVVEGELVRQRQTSDAEVPILGARVVMLSPDTGAPVSTQSVTVEGRFSVRLPPAPGEYTLRVTPTEAGEPIPELSLQDIPIDGSVNLGRLVAGEWDDPLEIEGLVSGVNGEPAPVEGAAAFFISDLELGTFSQIALAQEDGTFSSLVIPGSYEITLVPPPDVAFGAATFDEILDDAAIPHQFPLQHKPSLLGSVFGPTGELLGGVTVVSQPTGYRITTLSLGSVSTHTDTNGLYLLPVHPGPQRVMVLPPEDSRLAPRILRSVTVYDDHRMDFQLSVAARLSGGVRGEGGALLTGATVEAYTWNEGKYLLFAETETGADGRFEISLPVIQ